MKQSMWWLAWCGYCYLTTISSVQALSGIKRPFLLLGSSSSRRNRLAPSQQGRPCFSQRLRANHHYTKEITTTTTSSTLRRIHQHQQNHQHDTTVLCGSRSSRDQQEEELASSLAAAAAAEIKLYNSDRATLHDGSYSPQFLEDNGLQIVTDESGRVTALPRVVDNNNFLDLDGVDGDHDMDDVTLYSEVLLDTTNDDGLEPLQQTIITTTTTTTSNFVNNHHHVDNDDGLHRKTKKPPLIIKDHPAKVMPKTGFNVVLTHATADFDSLASAVGLAKLWSAHDGNVNNNNNNNDNIDGVDGDNVKTNDTRRNKDGLSLLKEFDSSSHVPTFVVLPRGAHPGVQRFLALHKHLFPIRSLKSLPTDLSGLNRLGLVDAQRRDRIGPAEHLLAYAKRVTIVDHHIDGESDITEATDYVVDKVGSVSTLMVERLREAKLDLTEAEATLLALGIHADTGSLCFDSTTPRDANALAWVLSQGASQAAIAEHARSSLSAEQQGVLTQALIYSNTTIVHGVSVATVLLSADGFINGLASVTEDALEMSSSDVFLLALVYEAGPGGASRKKKRKKQGELLQSRLFFKDHKMEEESISSDPVRYAEAWRGGDEALRRRRLRAAFDRRDTNGSGFLEKKELAAALASSGIISSDEGVTSIMQGIDIDGDGRIDFEEFVAFANDFEQEQTALKNGNNDNNNDKHVMLHNHNNHKAATMIIIGRVKAGVHMKAVKLNKLLEKFNGGGHPKAASATLRLNDESEAEAVLQGLVDELIETNLQEQPTVGDFMTAPVLSIKPHMTEKQVEDLFTRYDVRALPVVDDNNDVIGLVTYKEVAAAKQRLWNKEQKRRQQKDGSGGGSGAAGGDETTAATTTTTAGSAAADTNSSSSNNNKTHAARKLGSTVKGWMKQHVQVVETSKTMAEVEAILLENDVGCIPVVANGTRQLVGMVTRTDLLRQHRYYPSLHYHNKGFSDSIAARKPIIELRRKLKKFDIENE